MKQLMLITVCLLFAAFSSHAQAPYMNFNNTTSYTVYVSGLWGPASTCTGTANYFYAIPPGASTIDVGMFGGNVSSDEFIHIRVYSYDPAQWATCNPNPINSINLSPCPGGLPTIANIDIYDTCPFPVIYNATVQWDNTNSPTSVDVNIW